MARQLILILGIATLLASMSTGVVAQNAQRPFSLALIADGFTRPIFLVEPDDGSGRVFVAEQGGFVWVIQDGAVLSEPLLDISDFVTSGNEQGLLGLALHPDFPATAQFFVNFTDTAGNTEIVRYTIDPEQSNRADTDSALTILTVEQPYSNHNGGMLAFGSDGFLYISLGDGGSQGDPGENAQNTSTLLGSILRIDVSSSTESEPYTVPPDNPFVGIDEARAEIWSFGLRNPWRFSLDSDTGDLWIGDVGQRSAEEIDRQPAGVGGANFGWNLTEGFLCYAVSDCETLDITWPVFTYGRDLGISVVGGYVYRGPDLPSLTGSYVFGDYGSGLMWIAAPDESGEYSVTGPWETGLTISSLAEDASGSIYVIDLNGAIYKMTALG